MWFKKKPAEEALIKNARRPRRRTDFAINAAGLAILAMVVVCALAFRFMAGSPPGPVHFAILLAAPAAAMGLMTLFPRWPAAIKLIILGACALAAWSFAASGAFAAGADAGLALAFAALGIFIAPSIQKMEEWERAIVLRFGRFHRVKGPGLFVLLPFADRVAQVVDLRIRVTDFAAETTLSRDSVTVTVDALCFWLVWDAEKAVCEVQDYEEAVVLSSRTALRNAVSKNDLSVFLEQGENIEEQLRAEVDQKTTDWGITVQHIEITDIQIPDELQNSMSRLAQAEREKKGRILLAEAEIEVAKRFEEAAKIYGANETAMKLKSLSVLNEGLKAGNSMMIVPNSITEELTSKDLFGLQALGETRRHVSAESAVPSAREAARGSAQADQKKGGEK